jgi:hypothetical protein
MKAAYGFVLPQIHGRMVYSVEFIGKSHEETPHILRFEALMAIVFKVLDFGL